MIFRKQDWETDDQTMNMTAGQKDTDWDHVIYNCDTVAGRIITQSEISESCLKKDQQVDLMYWLNERRLISSSLYSGKIICIVPSVGVEMSPNSNVCYIWHPLYFIYFLTYLLTYLLRRWLFSNISSSLVFGPLHAFAADARLHYAVSLLYCYQCPAVRCMLLQLIFLGSDPSNEKSRFCYFISIGDEHSISKLLRRTFIGNDF